MSFETIDTTETCPVRTEARHQYGDVVSLVRELGDSAVNEFLDGLTPHFANLASEKPTASAELSRYLHDAAVSALAITVAGGEPGLLAAEVNAAVADAVTIDEAIARFQSFVS